MLKISPIACTIDHVTFAALADQEVSYPHGFQATEGTMPADALVEFAGRACYQSWSRPNPATAENLGYLANVLDHGHYSVLEHASVTFYVEGVSRALTHELVRHRHLSFSQLSQRFVDESEVRFVVPPAVRDLLMDKTGGTAQEAEDAFNASSHFDEVRAAYAELVEELTKAGLPRKQVREAARAVLPNCTETKIVVTGNLRAWRDFIARRNDPHADAEIREFAQAVLGSLKIYAPASVQDLGEVSE